MTVGRVGNGGCVYEVSFTYSPWSKKGGLNIGQPKWKVGQGQQHLMQVGKKYQGRCMKFH